MSSKDALGDHLTNNDHGFSLNSSQILTRKTNRVTI
jgi:hypothetical protein